MTTDRPMILGPVAGFRQWLVIDEGDGQGPMLRPLFTNTLTDPWLPGDHHARCTKIPACVSVPAGECECGLYARYNVDWQPGLESAMRRDHIKGRVSGLVLMWGDLELHHDGFRAQHGRVIALALPRWKDGGPVTKGVPGVARKYGADLIGVDELEALADRERFGRIPERLRPPEPPRRGPAWSRDVIEGTGPVIG